MRSLRKTSRALFVCSLLMGALCESGGIAAAQETRATATYRRFKERLDRIPAIDTHDHLFPFDQLPCRVKTKNGRGVNLAGLWHNSYYRRFNPLTPWKAGMDFDAWWQTAKHDFEDARATTFYRYQLPAFQDLYGVDFDHITDAQARDLDRRIFENYQDQRWIYHVVTERANIELMFNDPYWARYEFTTTYPWEVLVFNVTPLVRGFHASEFKQPIDSPYEFAKKHGLPVDSLDDYLTVLDRHVSRSQGPRRGLPEDDARLPANAVVRQRAQGAGGGGLRHAALGSHPASRSRTSRTSSCGGCASWRPNTSCRSRSTPATPASRAQIPCCWST